MTLWAQDSSENACHREGGADGEVTLLVADSQLQD